jgi:hypothetical protein
LLIDLLGACVLLLRRKASVQDGLELLLQVARDLISLFDKLDKAMKKRYFFLSNPKSVAADIEKKETYLREVAAVIAAAVAEAKDEKKHAASGAGSSAAAASAPATSLPKQFLEHNLEALQFWLEHFGDAVTLTSARRSCFLMELASQPRVSHEAFWAAALKSASFGIKKEDVPYLQLRLVRCQYHPRSWLPYPHYSCIGLLQDLNGDGNVTLYQFAQFVGKDSLKAAVTSAFVKRARHQPAALSAVSGELKVGDAKSATGGASIKRLGGGATAGSSGSASASSGSGSSAGSSASASRVSGSDSKSHSGSASTFDFDVIDFKELQFAEKGDVKGRGHFGYAERARWAKIDVIVKRRRLRERGTGVPEDLAKQLETEEVATHAEECRVSNMVRSCILLLVRGRLASSD